MPVFKAFFAIAKKRRNAALIYLGVYAVITLLMQAALCAITSHPSTRSQHRSREMTPHC